MKPGITKIIILITAIALSCAEARDFNVGIPNPVKSLNPLKAKIAQESFMIPLVFETLFFRDLKGDLLPLLAQKYEAGNNELVIHLNRAFFSNGDKLTAGDAIKALGYYCSTKSLHGRLSSLIGCNPHEKLRHKILGDESFKLFTLGHPNFAVEQLASASVPIFKVVKDKQLGTGVFKITNFVPNRLRLLPNKKNNFWEKRKVHFEGIQFEHIAENKIKSALESGELDLASMYFTPTVAKVDDRIYETISHSDSVVSALVLNKEDRTFKNKSLRLSLQKTFAKLDFSRCEFGGNKLLGIVPEGVGGYVEDLSLDKVLRGHEFYKVKRKTNVTIFRHEGRKSLCEEKILREAFKRHNLNLQIVYENDYEILYPKYLSKKTTGYVELFVFNSLEASSLLKRFGLSKSLSVFFYNSKEVQNELDNAKKEPFVADRFKFYRKINKMIFNQAIFLPMYSLGHSNVLRKCFKAKKKNSTFYNPNTFLFILDILSAESIGKCE